MTKKKPTVPNPPSRKATGGKKKEKMIEVTIHDKSVPIDAIPAKPERTAKVVFDNDYCRIVEDYDKAEECVFYTLTDKSIPNETHRFATMGEADRYANQRRLK